MASPTVQARVESAVTTAGTSHTVTRPTASAGRLVILFFAYAVQSQTITWPAGYTPITGFKNEQTGRGIDAAWHVDTGAEGSSITVTTSVSTKSCHLGYSISGHEDPAVQAIEIGTAATGTSATPDPPNIAPAGGSKDYLFVAVFAMAGEEADDDTWCNNAPTNYTNLVQITTGIGGAASTNVEIAAADRGATVSSENPATFGTDQSLAWTAQTLAISPAIPRMSPTSGLMILPKW